MKCNNKCVAPLGETIWEIPVALDGLQDQEEDLPEVQTILLQEEDNQEYHIGG